MGRGDAVARQPGKGLLLLGSWRAQAICVLVGYTRRSRHSRQTALRILMDRPDPPKDVAPALEGGQLLSPSSPAFLALGLW